MRSGSLKRGAHRQRVSLDQAISVSEPPSDDLLALDEALDRLAEEDPIKADLVKLRYFAGLSVEQTAEALGISRATADRYWSYAKVWLYQAVTGEDEPTGG
jgi:DNA-directed RNA polymerase specialized sigma24 family protein